MKIKYRIKKLKIWLVSLVLFISVIITVGFNNDIVDFEIAKNLDIYYTLFRELSVYYVDNTDPAKLIKTSIDGMLHSLDPYTVYIPESQMEDLKFMTTGQYGGIGAMIRKNGDYVVITEPYEGFPAQKAGLKAGDIIMEVDDKSIKGKKTEDVSELLKGQPNTNLKLLVKRFGQDELIEKNLMRQEIKINNVPYYGMVTKEVGYIRYTGFMQNTSDEVKKALTDLMEKQNAKSIVLDLRGNPGGLLLESVKICNFFVLKDQEIVSTKGKIAQWNNTYKATLAPIDSEIPLVILVDRASASASEIVAGAMQDLDRAVIIGQRTFGKGLVQTTRPLSYNAQLKVTTAKYYIPSGRCIQALEYSHRNEDGSVGKIPDSLISEFKTLNGRKVYDGGGILPDVVIEPEKLSNISVSLIVQNLIFDYATRYSSTHDSIPLPENFSLSREEYDDFIHFLKDKEFKYDTKSEEKLKELVDITTKEKYYDSARQELESLKKMLAHDVNKDIQTFREEIKELLEEEIITRYYYQKGSIEYTLKKDPGIARSIEIVSRMEDYYAILNGLNNPKEEKKTE